MDYRVIPEEQTKVSVIGIGGSMFQHISDEDMVKLLDTALEKGINVIDLATDHIDSFPKIGKALKGRREEFILCLHLGLTFQGDGQYKRSRDLDIVRDNFEKQLSELGTDYADIAYIHYVDELEDFNKVFSSGVYNYAQQLKKDGRIHKLGFGSHQAGISRLFLEKADFDLFMFSINPAYDFDPVSNNPLEEDLSTLNALHVAQERADLYRLAEKSGVAITVMKALGAGRLLKAETSPFKKALTIPQCIQYCLDRPAVVSCIIGVDSVEKLNELATYCETSAEERDYTFISGMQFEEMQGKCVYCNHCLPCPSDIDIASVNKFMDLALMGDELAHQHYLNLEHKAGECIKCGSCEKNCPFGVSVIEKMQEAVKLFGV